MASEWCKHRIPHPPTQRYHAPMRVRICMYVFQATFMAFIEQEQNTHICPNNNCKSVISLVTVLHNLHCSVCLSFLSFRGYRPPCLAHLNIICIHAHLLYLSVCRLYVKPRLSQKSFSSEMMTGNASLQKHTSTFNSIACAAASATCPSARSARRIHTTRLFFFSWLHPQKYTLHFVFNFSEC